MRVCCERQETVDSPAHKRTHTRAFTQPEIDSDGNLKSTQVWMHTCLHIQNSAAVTRRSNTLNTVQLFNYCSVCISVQCIHACLCAFKFACKPMCAFNFMLIHVCSTVCFNARLLYNMISVPNMCKHRDVTCIYLYMSADKYTLSQVVCVYAYAVTPLSYCLIKVLRI